MSFLKGYKTFIVAGLMVIVAVVNLSVGDTTLEQFLNDPNLWLLFGGLGFAGLRDAIR